MQAACDNVECVDLYCVEKVIIDLKYFIVFITFYTLFSYRMLLTANNLLYYYVLRVSSLDVPYLCT